MSDMDTEGGEGGTSWADMPAEMRQEILLRTRPSDILCYINASNKCRADMEGMRLVQRRIPFYIELDVPKKRLVWSNTPMGCHERNDGTEEVLYSWALDENLWEGDQFEAPFGMCGRQWPLRVCGCGPIGEARRSLPTLNDAIYHLMLYLVRMPKQRMSLIIKFGRDPAAVASSLLTTYRSMEPRNRALFSQHLHLAEIWFRDGALEQADNMHRGRFNGLMAQLASGELSLDNLVAQGAVPAAQRDDLQRAVDEYIVREREREEQRQPWDDPDEGDFGYLEDRRYQCNAMYSAFDMIRAMKATFLNLDFRMLPAQMEEFLGESTCASLRCLQCSLGSCIRFPDKLPALRCLHLFSIANVQGRESCSQQVNRMVKEWQRGERTLYNFELLSDDPANKPHMIEGWSIERESVCTEEEGRECLCTNIHLTNNKGEECVVTLRGEDMDSPVCLSSLRVGEWGGHCGQSLCSLPTPPAPNCQCNNCRHMCAHGCDCAC